MRRKHQLTYGAALLVGGLALLVLAIKPNEKTRIEQTVTAMARLCEARDAAGLAQHIAADYRGTIGSTRDEALESTRRAFEDLDALQVRILHVETDIVGDRAEAMIVFQTEGSFVLADTKSRLPFKNLTGGTDTKAEMVYCEFAKDGERWLLTYVTFDARTKLTRFPRTVAFLARQ
mgnify:CR=1 FL=1